MTRARRPIWWSVGETSRGTLAGTRLTNAFVADIDPARPALDDRVLMLLGHEMMHEWIGGKLHNAPDIPDGHLSWLTEGFTDYASARVLWRAGVFNDSTYVSYVNGWLSEYAMSPARDLTWPEVEGGGTGKIHMRNVNRIFAERSSGFDSMRSRAIR